MIVGASTAGAAAAYTLRAVGHEGPITLVGAEDTAPYERPPLSKTVLTAAEEPEAVWLLPTDTYASRDITLRLGAPVTSVELASGGFSLTIEDREQIAADVVVLATGGRARRPAGLPEDPRIHVLRTWADARALRAHMRTAHRALVLGSGLIGAECAASASAQGLDVEVLEMQTTPFPSIASRAVRTTLLRTFAEHGVRFRTGVTVNNCTPTDDGLVVQLSDGTVLEVDLLVVGIGIEPATELAERAGAATERGVLVDESMRTSVPGLYAAGDVASRRLGGRLIRHEHFASAQAQGEAAARAIAGLEPVPLPTPWAWSDQFSHRLEVPGEPDAADYTRLRQPGDGQIVEFSIADSRLVGLTALDQPRVVREARRLIGGRLRGSANDLERTDVPLKQLVDAP
ncbi:NAD(P)/FAD-dependent oxidoreductase [Nocardioides sp. B-3]|uniref:NAD(P)/FAD-dependent oxidoreductase n=1 Tax=Nocardioides sp. B-3 TaxID=2895565 RepID=UPI00215385ED|nr:FAD-dependent oxidoreductase [Nocardioides sp. B-3]UUZ59518.1 FAD-dependent oxidoreductase [Nocardioides sp. B-3]